MKSRDAMIISLIVGLAVLWLGTSPAPTDTGSLIGGWEFVSWCTACSGDGEEDCGRHIGCHSGVMASVCWVNPSGPDGCIPEPGGGYPCSSDWNWECSAGRDTDCG